MEKIDWTKIINVDFINYVRELEKEVSRLEEIIKKSGLDDSGDKVLGVSSKPEQKRPPLDDDLWNKVNERHRLKKEQEAKENEDKK